LAALVAAACGGAGQAAQRSGSTSPAPSAAGSSPSTSPTGATPPEPTSTIALPPTTAVTSRAAAPSPSTAAFAYAVAAVSAADLPYTWRPGCPVGPAALRMIHLAYWGFDGRSHSGSIVVNASVVPAVVTVFRTLFSAHFPIRNLVPEDAYRGDDNTAAAADDTSGFNCRDAVAPGPPQWSVHAFGEAIDVNDVENPYIDGSTIIPPAGAAYLNRAEPRPGMAVRGGVLVDAFASVGWQWGGRWSPGADYQHFSATGG
jgi:hypothetical protein